ncbi:hypothetical protein D3C72_2163300 [compost metagenome]
MLQAAIFSCWVLGAAAGLADRHSFMKALRSSPFLSAAWVLQAFIFSCCAVGALASLAGAAGADAVWAKATDAISGVTSAHIAISFFMLALLAVENIMAARVWGLVAALEWARCPLQHKRRTSQAR